MSSAIHHLTAVCYQRDGRPSATEEILSPSWSSVAEAIRRMDDYCYPVVQLNRTEHDDDDAIFNVIGGLGSYALFHQTGEWQYVDPDGSPDEVRLWQSGQGYFCAKRNIVTDIDKALRIVRVFYETGSYDDLDAVR
ncbi:hypothetical protein O7627_27260 [Solwaraspora sp. WMMD1047]|uniref:hypothetical protein n=1 Tax=Solwaraspora sp. WMMD1047 TaxID=3016102 RepID=UPI0024179B9D|nr:hypothetical protein [Solwaraspora sp. WMMD1047]MDG4832976.1 hypothetical protein [Solwaraspora sp. WMMD1047]